MRVDEAHSCERPPAVRVRSLGWCDAAVAVAAVAYIPAALITIGPKVWRVTSEGRGDEGKRRRAGAIETV